MIEHSIFIYCDSASHQRRVAVTNFDLVVGGLFSGWSERPASRAGERIGTGQTIVNDAPARTGWANDPGTSAADKRDRYDLLCRKCRKPVPVRQETLFAALDKCKTADASEVSLSALAAILSMQSE